MSERILSPQLTEEKAHQVEQLWSAASGRQWAQQHSAMYDRALLEILRHLELVRGESAPFTLVATGGYGLHSGRHGGLWAARSRARE